MAQKIQFLRNKDVQASKSAATTALVAKLSASTNAGEPIICTYKYTDNGTEKVGVLFGIAAGDATQQADNTYSGGHYTIYETGEGVSTSVTSAIADAINALDVTDSVVENQYVSSVSESDGKITVTREAIPVIGVECTAETDQFVSKIELSDNKVKATYSSISSSQVTRTETDTLKGTTVEDALSNLVSAASTLSTSQKVDLTALATPTEGYVKTYKLTQGETEVGKIDIPKDLVVTSGSVVYGTWSDNTFTENTTDSSTGTDTALKLVIANQEDPVYINTKSLVDIYTAGSGIAVSNNAISINLATTQDGNAVLETTNGLKVTKVQTSSSYGNSVNYPTITDVKFTPVKKEDTLDTALKNVDTNVATLANEVLKNEKVVADALTAMNDAAGFDENGKYSAVSGATYIANATSVKDATAKLDAAIKTLSTSSANIAAGEGISLTPSTDSTNTQTIAVKCDSASVTLNTEGKLQVGTIDCGEY